MNSHIIRSDDENYEPSNKLVIEFVVGGYCSQSVMSVNARRQMLATTKSLTVEGDDYWIIEPLVHKGREYLAFHRLYANEHLRDYSRR